MNHSVKNLKDTQFKEPMVVLPLQQYEALMEYLEDLEDRFAVIERANDENIPWEKVEKKFKKKFSVK